MPEIIRTANERLRSRPWRDGFLAAFVTAIASSVPDTPAHADVHPGATAVAAVHHVIEALRSQDITVLVLIFALAGFAVLTSLLLPLLVVFLTVWLHLRLTH